MDRTIVNALTLISLLALAGCGASGAPSTPPSHRLPPRGLGIDVTGETGSGIRLSGEASFGVAF
ncbi:argininosuccinate lyase [Pseudooceanicola aestuarii]|uniref:argininosuccinate lyase n=1 Tax=Pseudooceanicola aestuarii TaxID=2697319 RepID=UPI0013D59178|nr:argininosuccinate lyase [Pseudooceanicola aestuarii]